MDARESASRTIRTWERGLITLSEMVKDLQRIDESEHRKLLAAGAELAARRRAEKASPSENNPPAETSMDECERAGHNFDGLPGKCYVCGVRAEDPGGS